MEHLATCQGREEKALNAELAVEAEEKRKAEAGGPLARSFYCSKWERMFHQMTSLFLTFNFRCDRDMKLTSSEILRHKRHCGVKQEPKTLVSDYM